MLDNFMGDLKWTKNDLMSTIATVSMMDIPESNIIKLVDSTRDELDKVHLDLFNKVKKHETEGENVFIYAYAAGHGAADNRQYFLTNSNDP